MKWILVAMILTNGSIKIEETNKYYNKITCEEERMIFQEIVPNHIKLSCKLKQAEV